MKKIILTLTMIAVAVATMAVPAKRGLWKTIRLADGTEVRAQLCGDERVHYYVTADGEIVSPQDGSYVKTTRNDIRLKAAKSRYAKKSEVSRARNINKVSIGEKTNFKGKKKGIVILVNYTDKKFLPANTREKYNQILNEEGYTSNEGFRGSVSDYFKAQSNGQFELDFDVVGPYQLKNSRKYYGGNDRNGEDRNPEEMIVEACEAADADVNFSDYDWDGDGVVDQVFVLYAGTGEADSYDDDAIWPHEWELSYTNKAMKLDGVTIDTYACSNEVDDGGNIEGIGVFCHEFSHCMGYPDFYDVAYAGSFGRSEFDLMDMGSYNGNGFVPCGYSAYEKMMASWLDPIELSDEPVDVSNLKSMAQHGDAYIIYNKGHKDEYLILENRQLEGWDEYLPARGLMISYVDFDKEIWENNIPNTILSASDAAQNGYNTSNDHQRMTLIHADNDDDSRYFSSYTGNYYKTTLEGDLYPYRTNDSLTNNSKPAATTYHPNTDGKKFFNIAITKITQAQNGTVGFKYAPGESNGSSDIDEPVVPDGDYLFKETFDNVAGTGGNDGLWSNAIATKALANTDVEGWTALSDKAFSADRCAKFGTGTVVGEATTPAFAIDGEATLTFKAGAWNAAGDGTALALSATGGATIEPAEFTISRGEWTDCKATVKGTGTIQIVFTPGKRFFLDEVYVMKKATEAAISSMPAARQQTHVYSLDGRYMGTDLNALGHGIWVINGKKYVR